jgi:hypothetical protein
VPAFNLTFPATASTILSILLPEDTVDYLGIFVLARHMLRLKKWEKIPCMCFLERQKN